MCKCNESCEVFKEFKEFGLDKYITCFLSSVSVEIPIGTLKADEELKKRCIDFIIKNDDFCIETTLQGYVKIIRGVIERR